MTFFCQWLRLPSEVGVEVGEYVIFPWDSKTKAPLYYKDLSSSMLYRSVKLWRPCSAQKHVNKIQSVSTLISLHFTPTAFLLSIRFSLRSSVGPTEIKMLTRHKRLPLSPHCFQLNFPIQPLFCVKINTYIWNENHLLPVVFSLAPNPLPSFTAW